MIFISVDLPAPFSPSTAWISPGRDAQADAVVGLDGRVLLADVDELEAKHALSPCSQCAMCCLMCRRCTAIVVCGAVPASRRPRRLLTRLRSSASVIHANTRSCRSRATASRRVATGPTAQSQTQTSATQPGSSAADLVRQAERLRRAARRGVQRLPGASAARRRAPAPCRRRPSCAASTGWCRRRRRSPG